MNCKVTENDKFEIYKRYKSGESAKSISASYGIEIKTVYRIAESFGYVKRTESSLKRRYITADEEQDIIKDYMSGKSAGTIKQERRIPYSQVVDILYLVGDIRPSCVTDELIDLVMRRFFDDVPCNKIAAEFHTSYYIVSVIVKKQGYSFEHRNIQRNKNKRCNIKPEAYVYAEERKQGLSYAEIAERHGATTSRVISSGVMFLVYPEGNMCAFTDAMFIRAESEAQLIDEIDEEAGKRYRRLIAHRAKICTESGRTSDVISRWSTLAD